MYAPLAAKNRFVRWLSATQWTNIHRQSSDGFVVFPPSRRIDKSTSFKSMIRNWLPPTHERGYFICATVLWKGRGGYDMCLFGWHSKVVHKTCSLYSDRFNALNKLLAIFQKVSTTETCVLECSYPRNNSSGEAPLQTLVLDSSTMILIDQSYESGTRRTYVRICELEIAGICCHALNRLKRDCHNYSWVVVQDSRHFVV